MSVYPHHYEMKKNRLKIMEAANWRCDICGGEASEIHHADESDDNHEPSNLVPLCRKCHIDIHKIDLKRPIWNMYELERLMMVKGVDMKEIAEATGFNHGTITQIFKSGSTKNSTMKKIADFLEVELGELVIHGEIRKPRKVSTKNFKSLNEAMTNAVNRAYEKSDGKQDEKSFKRKVRIQLTGSIRSIFKVKGWTDLKGEELERAIKFLDSEHDIENWKEVLS